MDQDLTFTPAIKPIQEQLVEIPGGEIALRDDRLKRKWTVELQPFLLAKYPVAQELYFEITGENPGTFKGNKKPVETVSWRDAVNFCNALSDKAEFKRCYSWNNDGGKITFDPKANGYRLPTEAEWEHACKASYRIFRGGGWNDDERGCLATNRRRSHPGSFKIDDLGFRIARNVEL